MATALVLDGHLKSALSCVRSLGQSKISVVCGAERPYAMSLYSKYVAEQFVYVSPKVNQEKFVAEILAQAKKLQVEDGEKPIVFCFSDATLLTLVRDLQVLKEYIVISLPALESVEIASDKVQTYELAKSLSIPTITTYQEYEFELVTYPAVVKNRHSIVWKQGKSQSGSATFVFSKDELLVQFKKIKKETGEDPLVQQFIQGEEYGVEMVCCEGEPCAIFVHKRIRSLSPQGGAAVVKETALETEEVALMRMYAQKLAHTLKWHGPIMIEFKIDSETGEVLLMEINGRFWGSLPLAVRAGVNFPMMVYQLGGGHTVKKMSETSFPPYVRTRHFLGDCRWFLSVFFKKDWLRPILYPSRIRALWDFKKEVFISRGDVFLWGDLKPSIMEYIDIVSKR